MSRAYGWNAKLLIAEESTYGTLSSGPYTQVPFASSAIDSEQGLISSNVLGLGRDPTTPFATKMRQIIKMQLGILDTEYKGKDVPTLTVRSEYGN